MFKNKSDNLKILINLKLKKSKIPNFVDFTVKDWIYGDKIKIINKITLILNKKVCIRSAFALEDKINSSLAGKFESYLNISNKKKKIEKYVEKLILQYHKYDKKNVHKSKVFVQNYVDDSILSGVVTNFNLHDGTPYYVINYDNETNLTDTVTSGGKSGYRVLYAHKNHLDKVKSQRFRPLVDAVKEIEEKIKKKPVDIEFAVDKKKNVNILQIRDISTKKKWKKIDQRKFNLNLIRLKNKFYKIKSQNKSYGLKPIFGLMPDWNPVEMIGNFPSNLSYSLYSTLITNNSWSIARDEMGYKKINSRLMYNFSGRPYIDTRLSFFSFLPKSIKQSLSKKVVNYWCGRLKDNPYLHDKVEFDIADSCFDFSLRKKIYNEYLFFSANEKKLYFKSIKDHTIRIINNFEIDFLTYFDQLKKLENFRFNLIKSINNNLEVNYTNTLKKIISILKFNGIIPFAKFARNGFIGKKILNSIVEHKIISKNEYDKLFSSLNTVTSLYTMQEIKLKKNKIKKKDFDNLFFHLRAGTYDIESKRYQPKLKPHKLKNIEEILNLNFKVEKILTKNSIKKINFYFKKNDFNIDALKFIKYAMLATKLRENSKFIFTRMLSDLLEIIKLYGQKNNLTKKELSNLNIHDIIYFKKKFLKNKKINNNLNKNTQLPYLISDINDFFICSIQQVKPNFITNKSINSRIIKLGKNHSIKKKIRNRIVLIENADPGYDWIFSENINGLITKNGGVNSHMAIRCQELNLPAAIGIGESNFKLIEKNNSLNLNCKQNKVNILN